MSRTEGVQIPVDNDDEGLFEVQTNAAGPAGELPLDDEFLRLSLIHI